MQLISGRVVKGYQVASGKSQVSPYPMGTLLMQAPIFKNLGVNIDEYYKGTLNISIAPHEFRMRKPEYILRQVIWTEAHKPENFSFSRCEVTFDGMLYRGLVYYPDPETKQRHFPNPSIIEVLAPYIEGVSYGSKVVLGINPEEISIL